MSGNKDTRQGDERNGKREDYCQGPYGQSSPAAHERFAAGRDAGNVSEACRRSGMDRTSEDTI